MSTTIYALRHGESTFNRENRWQGRAPEPPLTALGQLQAEAAGILLSKRNVKFDAVVTSHLVRASQTGVLVGKQIGITEIEHIEDLQERDVGIYTGITFSEFQKLNVRSRSENNPGWEAGKDVEDRLVCAIQEIGRRYPGKTVVVVSHGGSLLCLSRRLGVNEERIRNLQGRIYYVDNTSKELSVGARISAPEVNTELVEERRSSSLPVIF